MVFLIWEALFVWFKGDVPRGPSPILYKKPCQKIADIEYICMSTGKFDDYCHFSGRGSGCEVRPFFIWSMTFLFASSTLDDSGLIPSVS